MSDTMTSNNILCHDVMLQLWLHQTWWHPIIYHVMMSCSRCGYIRCDNIQWYITSWHHAPAAATSDTTTSNNISRHDVMLLLQLRQMRQHRIINHIMMSSHRKPAKAVKRDIRCFFILSASCPARIEQDGTKMSNGCNTWILLFEWLELGPVATLQSKCAIKTSDNKHWH